MTISKRVILPKKALIISKRTIKSKGILDQIKKELYESFSKVLFNFESSSKVFFDFESSSKIFFDIERYADIFKIIKIKLTII